MIVFLSPLVAVRAASSEEEVMAIVRSAGAAPCATLIVNASRHPRVAELVGSLLADPERGGLRWELAHGLCKQLGPIRAHVRTHPELRLVQHGNTSVGRREIGVGVTFTDHFRWERLDALLLADSFQALDALWDDRPAS